MLKLHRNGWYLQDIQSCVKKYHSHTDEYSTDQIEARIFDIPSHSGTYAERLDLMQHGTQTEGLVTTIPAITCKSHQDIEDYYNKCISARFEGIIIRNTDGLYEYNVRSSDCFKYKKQQDCERQIVDYNIDKNSHPVFVVKTDDNKIFKVKMKGTNEERLAIASNADSYIGKWLNLSFECYSKEGICLKPVGNYIRECDTSGEPIE